MPELGTMESMLATMVASAEQRGEKIGVLRPLDPQRAVRRAQELVQESRDCSAQQQDAAFQTMLREQPYQFVGVLGPSILAPGHCVYGPEGTPSDVLAPGDSFVSMRWCFVNGLVPQSWYAAMGVN